jgi:hypothetical protein
VLFGSSALSGASGHLPRRFERMTAVLSVVVGGTIVVALITLTFYATSRI